MSLKRCEECNGEMSSSATKCPHCGKKYAGGCAKFIAILFVLFILAAAITEMNKPPKVDPAITEEQITYKDAVYASRQFVRMYLKSPKSADFPIATESDIINIKDDVYTVRSYVDAINSFNANLRYSYKAKIRYNKQTKMWKLVSMDIK